MNVTVDELPMLEQVRQQFQRSRIRMTNRLAAVDDGRSFTDTSATLHFAARFQSLEDEAAAMIAEAIKDHDMWPWMQAVKGIGPGLRAQSGHLSILSVLVQSVLSGAMPVRALPMAFETSQPKGRSCPTTPA